MALSKWLLIFGIEFMENDLSDLKADIKIISESMRLIGHEQEKKNDYFIEHMRKTNEILNRHDETLNGETGIVKQFEDHKTGHFSWVTIGGAFIGILSGIAVLINWIRNL